MSDGTPPPPGPGGVRLRRNFLAPFALVGVLDALDGLSPFWAQSERLGLVGRGGVSQVAPGHVAARAPLDRLRQALAPAALQWARGCGFALPAAPHLQLFPVRMVGSADAPAYQQPHVDSAPGQAGAPVCTNVFYARARDIVGGELVVAAEDGPEGSDPVAVSPQANTLVSFGGGRTHWVRPLLAGERLSVVINFY